MIKLAIRLLKAGEPLPLDLVYRLVERGIDVSELERRFAL